MLFPCDKMGWNPTEVIFSQRVLITLGKTGEQCEVGKKMTQTL